MSKMPAIGENHFRYFSLAPGFACWGLGVTAAGFTRVPPGSPYPPAQHPADHRLDWAHGRVLAATQIVLITAGRGWFETRQGGRKVIHPGTAFLILPGVWHRYRPDPKSGWEESWLEVQGPVIDALQQADVLSARSDIRRGALAAGLDAALEAVHQRARQTRPGFDPELAACALRVLATWDQSKGAHRPPPRVRQAVMAAERHLKSHIMDPINIERLSRRLGMAYSHFRRAFRTHTGFAPWQYVLHLRLTQARRQLAAGDETLEVIASRLGFSSPSHFSKVFKQSFGTSPMHWRQQLHGVKLVQQRKKAGR